MNETGSHEERLARQFTELFTANYGPVLAYVQRRAGGDLAQDLVADTFLAAWRNIHELPPDPLPWLYRAAHFAIANQRRTLARRSRLDDRARLQAGTAVDLELAAAFRALSEADREVLRLAAWEGLRPAEIGVVDGCSTVAAKTRLHRARQRLSRRLGTAGSQRELRSRVQEITITGAGI